MPAHAPRPALVVRIRRSADGTASTLHCERADGTATWQTTHGRTGAFFPAHDLTHYAVETTLGTREGFYGLLAAGWDIANFASGSPRGPLPAEAELVERIVGVLDMQRASGVPFDAPTFRAELESLGTDDPHLARVLAVVDAETLARLVTVRDALLARWAAVPAGGEIELRYPKW